jgi:hypothetical protein
VERGKGKVKGEGMKGGLWSVGSRVGSGEWGVGTGNWEKGVMSQHRHSNQQFSMTSDKLF